MVRFLNVALAAAAVTSSIAAASFFGIFGDYVYTASYLIAIVFCLLFLSLTLVPSLREKSETGIMTLGQAGCVGIVAVGQVGLSENVNSFIVVCSAFLIVYAFVKVINSGAR